MSAHTVRVLEPEQGLGVNTPASGDSAACLTLYVTSADISRPPTDPVHR